MYASVVRCAYVWTLCAFPLDEFPPRKRWNAERSAVRIAIEPTATTPSTAASATARRGSRRTTTSSTTTNAVASPSSADSEPAMTAPSAPAAISVHASGPRRTTTPASSAPAESAAKSLEPRNDACRFPNVPFAATGRPNHSSTPTSVAAALQSASDQSTSSRSFRVRTSSGSAGASSAYSYHLSSVTRCVRNGYAPIRAAPYSVASASHTARNPHATQIQRPASSGAKPSRTPVQTAATTPSSTARSDNATDPAAGCHVRCRKRSGSAPPTTSAPGEAVRRTGALETKLLATGKPTIRWKRDDSAPRDRRRDLRRRGARLCRDGRGGAGLPVDRGLRPLRDRDRHGRVLPDPARPDRGGSGDQVRLPLRGERAVGEAAAPAQWDAGLQARRRAAGGDRDPDSRAFRRLALRRSRHCRPARDRRGVAARAGAGGTRRSRALPPRPLRRARRVSHVLDGVAARGCVDRRVARPDDDDRADGGRAGGRDRVDRIRRLAFFP